MALLYELVHSQEERHGDFGIFTVILTVSLVKMKIEHSIPKDEFSTMATLALHWCLEFIDNAPAYISRKVALSDFESFQCLMKSTIRTKHATCLTERQLERVAISVVEGFLASLTISNAGATPDLKLLFQKGVSTMETRVCKQEIFLDIPLPPRLVHLVEKLDQTKDFSVLIFDVSLRLENSNQFNIEAEITDPSTWTLHDAEISLLKNLAQTIIRLNVRCVFSQKLIHPWLRNFLLQHNILAVERLSVRYIAAVRSLTGAHVFSEFPRAIKKEQLGVLGAISLIRLAGRQFTCLKGSTLISTKRVATLILCGMDQGLLDELNTVVERSMLILKNFVQSPNVLAGAGCIEWFLAQHIRRKTEETKAEHTAKTRLGLEGFAAALENIVTALELPNNRSPGGMTRFDVLDQLAEANSVLFKPFGWDPFAHKVSQMCVSSLLDNPHAVYDSSPAKRHALEVAVQASIVLIRIGSVVRDTR